MKKALVIGGALSGLAASQWLSRQGWQVYLTDLKPIAEKKTLEKAGITVFDGGHPDSLKEIKYDLIVKNPGIPLTADFVAYFIKQGYPIRTEMDLALQKYDQHPCGAVTGTNGKTTTTTLLGLLLQAENKQAVSCGNIGLPVCAAMENCSDPAAPVAVEVSAFQLVSCQNFHPRVSVIMNLTPDHLNWFKDADAYYRAKTLVYHWQDKNDYFLRNVDDKNVVRYAVDIPAQVIDFSLDRTDVPLHIANQKVWLNDTELFELSDLQIPGRHNIQNAMVAAAMAYLLKVSPADIKKVIRSFAGVEHRIEFVRTVNGVSYYNDSKGTNVDATIVALKAFDCPVHLLVGGYDKKLPFDGLKPYLGHVKAMYAFGTTREKFKEIYPDVQLFDDMVQAVSQAHRDALPNEVVLLSPACASWDQFPNFEVRGRQFKQMVNSF